MIYPIYIYGSQALRKECEPITEDFPDLAKFVKDMFETMYAADGVGLAAPQIGKNVKMFVIDPGFYAPDNEELKDTKRVYINPEIYEESVDEIVFTEGCLSIPGIHEDVSRPEAVKIRYLDENLQPHDELLEGYVARVVQHEYDHLQGTLFTDHLAPLRKTLVGGKLNGMSKGKFSAGYRTKQVK